MRVDERSKSPAERMLDGHHATLRSIIQVAHGGLAIPRRADEALREITRIARARLGDGR